MSRLIQKGAERRRNDVASRHYRMITPTNGFAFLDMGRHRRHVQETASKHFSQRLTSVRVWVCRRDAIAGAD